MLWSAFAPHYKHWCSTHPKLHHVVHTARNVQCAEIFGDLPFGTLMIGGCHDVSELADHLDVPLGGDSDSKSDSDMDIGTHVSEVINDPKGETVAVLRTRVARELQKLMERVTAQQELNDTRSVERSVDDILRQTPNILLDCDIVSQYFRWRWKLAQLFDQDCDEKTDRRASCRERVSSPV